MSFSEQFPIVFAALNTGFLQTLKLFVVTLLGAIPLGLIISFGSMARFKPLAYLTRTVVWVFRGSPLMLQLLIIYFGPGLLFGTPIWGGGESGRFLAAAVAFIFARQIIIAFGCPPSAVDYAVDYLRIYACGTLFVMLAQGMSPFTLTQGYSLFAMGTVLVGALVGPLLRTLAVVFMLRLSAALLEPIADGDIVCAIGDFSRTVVLFFITMLCVGTMYFLLIVQVLLVGNLTVLLR